MARRNFDQQRRVFVPGQYLGDFAAGTEHAASGHAVGDTSETRPVGEKLAKEFPWMQCIRMDWAAAGTVPSGSTIRFMRPNGDFSFLNDTTRPVRIDEIRVFSMPPQPYGTTNSTFTTLSKNAAIQVKTQEKDIVGQWLPLYAFNTESNRKVWRPRHNGVFRLPAKYYLQRGHTFQMRVRNRGAFADTEPTTYTISFGLSGRDPINESPIKLCKEGTLTTTAASEILVTFDENRDVPLRDAILDHIAVGGDKLNDAAVAYAPYGANYNDFANIEVQFIPPEGPKWQNSLDWFPLWGLVHQPGLYFNDTYAAAPILGLFNDSQAIHRPATPYILLPRQAMTVDLLSFGLNCTVGQTPIETYPVYCAVYGRQESMV